MTKRIWGSAAITAMGSGLTYMVHRPSVGIDDANITQTYAQHIAQGAGYVYNIGQERVEGSTSLVWTLINAAAFKLSDTPEIGLALLCLLLTWMSVHTMLTLTSHWSKALGADGRWGQVLAGVALLCVPGWFAWSAWTLMDLTLWVLALTVAVERALAVWWASPPPHAAPGEDRPGPNLWPLWLAIICLPLIRPEGLLLSGLLTITMVAQGWMRADRPLLRHSLLAGMASLLLLAGVTAWRLSYFGYPVPNTFYAKVSFGLIEQARVGSWYLQRFLQEPAIFVMLAACVAGASRLWQSRREPGDGPMSVWLLLAPLGLVMGLYMGVGGDHFGSFRQFQVIVPLMAAGAGATLAAMLQPAAAAARMPAHTAPAAALAVYVGACLVPAWLGYTQHKGHIDIEFRLAESGRALGAQLNALSGRPSVAITAAGGIARTYQGRIVDMMGLNWTEMAHASKVHDVTRPKNHQSFDKATFYRAAPTIVLPKPNGCDERQFDEDAFSQSALNHLFSDDQFRTLYTFSCLGHTRLYVRRAERQALALPDLARSQQQASAMPAP